MRWSHSFRERCEALATDLRLQLGRRVIDPLPAKQLFKALDADGRLVTPADLEGLSVTAANQLAEGEDWSAGIIVLKPLTILYNPRHSLARQESDLMHELAHVLLKHPLRSFARETELAFRDDHHEAEAIYLGACLQIPRRALLWAAYHNYTVSQVATHFGASEALVRFRCNMTGTTKKFKDY